MITFTRAQLEHRAKQRPQGYIEDVLRHAVVEGDDISLSEEDHKALVEKYSAPGLMTMARTSGFSMKQWIENGGQVVTQEQYDARLDVCKGCEFWKGNAMINGGRCMKCGCFTKFKLRMATEKCPIDKWGPTIKDAPTLRTERYLRNTGAIGKP